MRTDGYAADKMYVIMHADIIMNIRDSGVEVFEWNNIISNIIIFYIMLMYKR